MARKGEDITECLKNIRLLEHTCRGDISQRWTGEADAEGTWILFRAAVKELQII